MNGLNFDYTTKRKWCEPKEPKATKTPTDQLTTHLFDEAVNTGAEASPPPLKKQKKDEEELGGASYQNVEEKDVRDVSHTAAEEEKVIDQEAEVDEKVLKNLPPEILKKVFSFLDLNSLNAVKLVSKNFSEIAHDRGILRQFHIQSQISGLYNPETVVRKIQELALLCEEGWSKDGVYQGLVDYGVKINSCSIAFENAQKIKNPLKRIEAYYEILKLRVKNRASEGLTHQLCVIVAKAINELAEGATQKEDREPFAKLLIKLISLKIKYQPAADKIVNSNCKVFSREPLFAKVEGVLSYFQAEGGLSSEVKDSVLLEAVLMLKKFKLREAISIGSTIEDEGVRKEALVSCFIALARKKDVKSVINRVVTIYKENHKKIIKVLVEVSKKIDRSKAEELVDYCEGMMTLIDEESSKKDELLKEIALGAAKLEFERAKKLVDLIADNKKRLKALFEVVRASDNPSLAVLTEIEKELMLFSEEFNECQLIKFNLFIINSLPPDDRLTENKLLGVCQAYVKNLCLGDKISDLLEICDELKDRNNQLFVLNYAQRLIDEARLELEKRMEVDDLETAETDDNRINFQMLDELSLSVDIEKANIGHEQALERIIKIPESRCYTIFNIICNLVRVDRARSLSLALSEIVKPNFQAQALLEILNSD